MKKKYSLLSIALKFVAFIGSALLVGCASAPDFKAAKFDEPSWMAQVIDYANTLPADHPDNLQTMFELPLSTKNLVRTKFGGLPKNTAIKKLAQWLIEEDGHNMQYDVNANFSPSEAFVIKQGNCLSFTMLLSALAAEIDVNIEFNEVDIPDFYGFDDQSGLIFYRHVNGIYRGYVKHQIFDLAMESYRREYPQRFISRQQAVAKMHSNRAVQELNDNPTDEVLHAMKLAVSLAPESSDLWVNLGVIYRRLDLEDRAELAYLKGLQLDPLSPMAASNLERLYRTQGKTKQADRYRDVAERARLSNPYYHFTLAQNQFKADLLRKAKSSIQAAIRLHSHDARFYELSSRIAQRQLRFSKALRDLSKAYAITQEASERERYAFKANLVNERAQQQRDNRERVRRSFNSGRYNNNR